jgi:hypothetical protein
MPRTAENPIKKTTKGKGANYRPTEKGAGMTEKGVKEYRKKNPGSKLKTVNVLLARSRIALDQLDR